MQARFPQVSGRHGLVAFPGALLIERYRPKRTPAASTKIRRLRLPAAEIFDWWRHTIERLKAQPVEQRTDSLLYKERQEGLNLNERRELQAYPI
jgi:hypothetical protein